MNKKIIFSSLIFLLVITLGIFFVKSYLNNKKNIEISSKTDKSLDKILENKKIVIGTSALFEPMSYLDENGNIVGFDIDLARAIAKKLGIDLELKPMAFIDLFGAVKERDIDLAIDSITITTERQKSVLFSTAYLTTGQIILVRGDNENILSEKDLAGKKVGVQRGTTGGDEALKYIEGGEVIPYDNREEITALEKGEIDAIVTDYLNAVMEIKRVPALKVAGRMFSEEYYGIMTEIQNNNLISEVNKIIREMMLNGEIKEMERKWGISQTLN